MAVELIPVKTRRINPPKDDFKAALSEALSVLQEGDVVCITSKVVSIGEGRCVPVAGTDKDALVQAEADHYLSRTCSKYDVTLTAKNSTLIAASGIDASNSADHYVLWPERPFETARQYWQELKAAHSIEKLGVILTDSHCTPLRYGTGGISIGSWGIAPLQDYRQTPDLFGREFEMSVKNVVDGLAAAANCLMGEGTEQTPAVIIRNWPGLTFTDLDHRAEFLVAPEDDLFAPLLVPLLKGKSKG